MISSIHLHAFDQAKGLHNLSVHGHNDGTRFSAVKLQGDATFVSDLSTGTHVIVLRMRYHGSRCDYVHANKRRC